MVNRGEEKVRVHMNVVPRSTRNTNSGTSELILCSTICVPSATRHNIHMYPYFCVGFATSQLKTRQA